MNEIIIKKIRKVDLDKDITMEIKINKNDIESLAGDIKSFLLIKGYVTDVFVKVEK